MSNIRKLSTFRQLSLSCETSSHEQRRKSLKKQFSEDLPDLKDSWLDPSVCFKIAVNSKSKKSFDRPPPVKIAWEENGRSFSTEDAVIIKKCTEVKRPLTGKLARHNSLENDSILCSKPKTNEILQPREPDKPNLNIFLAYNTKETACKPKIMAPLFATDHKNLLQVRKNQKPKINLNDLTYSVARTLDKPVLQRQDSVIAPFVDKEAEDKVEDMEPKPINNVVVRPTTAAMKREEFQKRSKTKENIQNVRPPLVRSSSAPCKPDQTKSKFLTTKRKIKSAKRTQQKQQETAGEEREDNLRGFNRSISVNGSDIVTMVSLVSPDGSDVEESAPDVKEVEKAKPLISPNRQAEADRSFSLRKAVKSVTFQQSSIHAVRSFSASFPARRGSMATTLMLNQNRSVGNNQKINEKRSPLSPASDDDPGPKRKVVKGNFEKSRNQSFDADEPPQESIKIEITEKAPSVDVEEARETAAMDKDATDEEVAEDNQPKFETTKEKQCWDMYCKMLQKGVNVSYDTILRGMLTPTEYRLRRKDLIETDNQ